MKNNILDSDFINNNSNNNEKVTEQFEFNKGDLIWQRFSNEKFIFYKEKYLELHKAKPKAPKKESIFSKIFIYAFYIFGIGLLIVSLVMILSLAEFLMALVFIGLTLSLSYILYVYFYVDEIPHKDQAYYKAKAEKKDDRITKEYNSYSKKWNLLIYENGIEWLPIKQKQTAQFFQWNEITDLQLAGNRIQFNTLKVFQIDEQDTQNLLAEFEDYQEARHFYKILKEKIN